MSKEEIIQIVDNFINENGLWYKFKDHVEEQGYTVKELGFPDND